MTSQGAGVGLAALVVAAAGIAALLPRHGVDWHSGFERQHVDTEATQELHTQAYTRSNIIFLSGDNVTNCAAWLYLPKAHSPSQLPPVVAMAHGLGGQRDFGLHKTADAFATAGFAVFVFDYRTFGGSDGEPRHWVSPSRHLQDWAAAVRHIQGPQLSGLVNSSNLVLWGTSYSGGHVLVTAAALGSRVKAVVSQVPHLSGPAASSMSLSTRGLLHTVKLGLAGVYDTVTARLGLPPVYVRLAGLHKTTCIMAMTESELQRYSAKHPPVKLGGWQNKALARLALEAPGYSPIQSVPQIKVPVMFIAVSNDTLCPYRVVQQAAAMLNTTVLSYDTDHFSLYLSDVWRDSVEKQLHFMCGHTGLQCDLAAAHQAVSDSLASS